MIALEKAVIIVLFIGSCFGCADNRRESRQHNECMQRAAWEEK